MLASRCQGHGFASGVTFVTFGCVLTPTRLLLCLVAIAIPAGLYWPIDDGPNAGLPPACPVTGTFASACALLNHGHAAAARKQTEKLLVAHPAASPPKALDELTTKAPKSRRERFREAVGAWAPIVLWVLTAAFGLWLVVREVFRWVRSRNCPHLVIEAFTGGDQADNPALATGFSRELQELVNRIDETGGPGIDVSQPGSTETLQAAVTSPIPQLNIVAGFIALLRAFVPTNDFKLTGHLHPPTAYGVGVSLALARQDGVIEEQVMLRQATFGAATLPAGTPAGVGFEALALAASAWTRATIKSVRGDPSAQGEPVWMATALLAAGALWQRRAELATAKRLYYAALRLEPSLVGALHNLGDIERREGLATFDFVLYARGRARIARARELSAS